MSLPSLRAATARYLRVVEAAVYAAVARAMIRLVPFRYLTRAFTWPARRRGPDATARARAVADVRRAVASAAARLPGRTTCFARAAAAQAMLRRRGIATTLYYGATTTADVDQRLRAHVWLRAGDIDVVGQEAAARYSVVMSYSSIAQPSVSPGRTHEA